MTVGYLLVVNGAVMETVAASRQRDRDELIRICKSLASHPYQSGDFTQRTASGRRVEVKRFGRWLVTFWPDHAVAELRIVHVERLVP